MLRLGAGVLIGITRLGRNFSRLGTIRLCVYVPNRARLLARGGFHSAELFSCSEGTADGCRWPGREFDRTGLAGSSVRRWNTIKLSEPAAAILRHLPETRLFPEPARVLDRCRSRSRGRARWRQQSRVAFCVAYWKPSPVPQARWTCLRAASCRLQDRDLPELRTGASSIQDGQRHVRIACPRASSCSPRSACPPGRGSGSFTGSFLRAVHHAAPPDFLALRVKHFCIPGLPEGKTPPGMQRFIMRSSARPALDERAAERNLAHQQGDTP
jgi:hypothetical protein